MKETDNEQNCSEVVNPRDMHVEMHPSVKKVMFYMQHNIPKGEIS